MAPVMALVPNSDPDPVPTLVSASVPPRLGHILAGFELESMLRSTLVAQASRTKFSVREKETDLDVTLSRQS